MRWRRVAVRSALGLVVVANLALVWSTINAPLRPSDFLGYQMVASALRSGSSLYADPFYRWSPFAAALLIPIAAMGLAAWQAAHIPLLALLGNWRLAVAVALSWPFWVDIRVGSTFFLVFIAAAQALRGSRVGIAAYLGLCLLMPRPLMAPLAIWLLWHRPEWRIPFALAAFGEVALLAATGNVGSWLGVLLGTASSESASPWNYGPSRFVGSWWCLVGLPLAAYLTWRGRLGLASLAASPYWLVYYLLFVLLEFVPSSTAERGSNRLPRLAGQPLASIDPRGWIGRPRPVTVFRRGSQTA